MACARYVPPVVSSRKLIVIGLEDQYGEKASRLSAFPVYDASLPIQPAFESAATQEDSVAGFDAIRIGGGQYTFAANVYLDGSGDPLNPPPWMQILECSGFVRDTATRAPYAIYGPGNEKSMSFETFFSDIRHVGTGGRFTFVISGEAGKPVQLAFNGNFLYHPRDIKTVSYTITPAKIPPRYVKSQSTITTEEEEIIPVQKNLVIDSGIQLLTQLEDTIDGSPSAFFIKKPIAPTWEITVEIERDFDWIERIYRNEVPCALKTVVGQEQGRMIEIKSERAQLISDPTYGEVGGIAVCTLRFGLSGTNFLQFLHK